MKFQNDNSIEGVFPTFQCNYTISVYGVATICHQVRCLRWGHPSLLHTITLTLP